MPVNNGGGRGPSLQSKMTDPHMVRICGRTGAHINRAGSAEVDEYKQKLEQSLNREHNQNAVNLTDDVMAIKENKIEECVLLNHNSTDYIDMSEKEALLMEIQSLIKKPA